MSEAIQIDRAVIAARRQKIRDDAPCIGCRSTLAQCEAHRGKDPTAPAWFGCCARGTAMAPCSHQQDPAALRALLDEIAAGHVRTVEELPQPKKRPIVGSVYDQGEWWQQKSGSWVRIAEMSPGHRYNSAAMILRGAGVIGFGYSVGFALEADGHDGGDMAHESLQRAADDLARRIADDPCGWMRETPVYRALTAGLTIHGGGTRPWQATRTDPVTGEETEVPPRMVRVCEIPDCGCSGEEHA